MSTFCATPTGTGPVSTTSPSRRTVTSRGARVGALILDLISDGLRLPDDAEARRGDERDAAVALVLVAGDEGVERRGKAERAGVGRHVVDAAVGDHDDAGDAIGRHVGEARAQRGEQAGAVGLGVRLAGLDHAHLEPGHAVQPLDDGGARFFGLPRAVAEILARALVDHDDGDGAERIAVLAREGGVRQRQHDESERDGAHDGAAAARGDQQQSQHRRQGGGRPENFGTDERRERDTEVQRVLLITPPSLRGTK